MRVLRQILFYEENRSTSGLSLDLLSSLYLIKKLFLCLKQKCRRKQTASAFQPVNKVQIFVLLINRYMYELFNHLFRFFSTK
jgi:hypothetical protein